MAQSRLVQLLQISHSHMYGMRRVASCGKSVLMRHIAVLHPCIVHLTAHLTCCVTPTGAWFAWFVWLQAQIIASQPAERQAHLSACLDRLMADVQRNLEPKNRDKFTQNLTVVRHEYRSKS